VVETCRIGGSLRPRPRTYKVIDPVPRLPSCIIIVLALGADNAVTVTNSNNSTVSNSTSIILWFSYVQIATPVSVTIATQMQHLLYRYNLVLRTTIVYSILLLHIGVCQNKKQFV